MSQMPTLDVAGDRNWIPDRNRYQLPKPPAWFLKVLWDFDAALVLLPSRQSRKYLLARRREFSRVIATVIEKQKTASEKTHPRVLESDSDLLSSRSLVLVDAITHRFGGNVAWGSWMRSCPEMMTDLRNRDMWAAGGADRYIEQLETREREADDRRRTRTADDMEYRAADAWRSYQARTGQRTRLPGTVPSSKAKIVQVGTL